MKNHPWQNYIPQPTYPPLYSTQTQNIPYPPHSQYPISWPVPPPSPHQTSYPPPPYQPPYPQPYPPGAQLFQGTQPYPFVYPPQIQNLGYGYTNMD